MVSSMQDAEYNQRIRIRDFMKSDISAMVALDAVASADPWDRNAFLRAVEHRSARVLVATIDNHLAGYAIQDKQNLVRIVVAPDFRRRGVGTELLQVALVGATREPWNDRLKAEVPDTNLDAHLFFKACGGRAVGVERQDSEPGAHDRYLVEVQRVKGADRIVRAIGALEDATGVQWELARTLANGQTEPVDLIFCEAVGATSLRLKTRGTIEAAGLAAKRINDLWGLQVAYPQTQGTSSHGHVLIDVDDLVETRIARGSPGKLADAFRLHQAEAHALAPSDDQPQSFLSRLWRKGRGTERSP
jgi:ribosomal-protein-alanine N-acetyltransferase